MTALSTRDALVAFTRQAMVTGYVTLLHQQDAIRRNLGAGMTPGDTVIAVLGDEPAQFLDTRRDLTEAIVDVDTLADDEALVDRAARAMLYRWPSDEPVIQGDRDQARRALTALAAALSERGEQS